MEEDSDYSADANTPLRAGNESFCEEGNTSFKFDRTREEFNSSITSEESSIETHANINAIREQMPLKSDIDFEGCDDEMLLRYLRARGHNVVAAFALLCSHIEFHKNNPELLKGLNAFELRYILEDGFPCVLPYMDPVGSTIMVLFPGMWDTDTFSPDTLLQALMLTLMHLSESLTVQSRGVVLLVDFSEWTSTQAAYLNIKYIKKIVTIFENCYPVVFKSVHLINQPWYISALISFLRPFLTGKVKDRVFLHGNNLTTLHDHIPPESLPSQFGGDRCEVDQSYWAKVLLEADKRKVKLKRQESVIRFGTNPLKSTGNPNKVDSDESEPLLLDED